MGVVIIKKRSVLGSEGDVKSFLDGSMVNFVTPANISNVADYCFYNDTNLKYIKITPNISNINDDAFRGCKKVVALDIAMDNMLRIGDRAFHQIGRQCGDRSVLFSLECNQEIANATSFGRQSFSHSRLDRITGNIGNIDFEAFRSLSVDVASSVGHPYIDISIYGDVGSYAFSDNVHGIIYINKSSNVKSIDSRAFYSLNSRASNFNECFLDFRNSTFTKLSGGTFSMVRGTNIFLPETLSDMTSSYDFDSEQYCNICFQTKYPPNTYSGVMSGSNNRIFAPYQFINLYKTYPGSGWPRSFVYGGWAPGGTFQQGEVLPLFNDEGYMLTWYDDILTTSVVTEVNDPDKDLFCIAGQTKEMFKISNIFTTNCSISISDGTRSYSLGDFVEKETVLTITATPNNPNDIPYAFTVNRSNFVSGNTITVLENIEIFVAYWDGQTPPIDSVFANNSWDMIYAVFRGGLAMQYWSLGDTKPITLTNGETYNIRIADADFGRYEIVHEGLASNGVLEFVEVISNGSRINTNNTGGWALCLLRKNQMPEIYDLLPQDLKSILHQVFVLSGVGNRTQGGTSGSVNYLFLPAENEIVPVSESHYSVDGECPGGLYGLYVLNPSASFRVKSDLGGTSRSYWYRSPVKGGWGDDYCLQHTNGNVVGVKASGVYWYSPCFAI